MTFEIFLDDSGMNGTIIFNVNNMKCMTCNVGGDCSNKEAAIQIWDTMNVVMLMETSLNGILYDSLWWRFKIARNWSFVETVEDYWEGVSHPLDLVGKHKAKT